VQADGKVQAEQADGEVQEDSLASASFTDASRTFEGVWSGPNPTGAVQLGSPPVTLSLILDTGSSGLVLKSWAAVQQEILAVDVGLKGELKSPPTIYNHAESKSYKRRIVEQAGGKLPAWGYFVYGSGKELTQEGEDTARIGAFAADRVPISEVVKDTLQLLHNERGISGILGLQHMRKSHGVSFFSRLRDKGLVYSFGICQARPDDGSVSTFIWGDASLEGTPVDVVGKAHWAVPLKKIQLPKALPKSPEIKPISRDAGSLLDMGQGQGDRMLERLQAPIDKLRAAVAKIQKDDRARQFLTRKEFKVPLQRLLKAIRSLQEPERGLDSRFLRGEGFPPRDFDETAPARMGSRNGPSYARRVQDRDLHGREYLPYGRKYLPPFRDAYSPAAEHWNYGSPREDQWDSDRAYYYRLPRHGNAGIPSRDRQYLDQDLTSPTRPGYRETFRAGLDNQHDPRERLAERIDDQSPEFLEAPQAFPNYEQGYQMEYGLSFLEVESSAVAGTEDLLEPVMEFEEAVDALKQNPDLAGYKDVAVPLDALRNAAEHFKAFVQQEVEKAEDNISKACSGDKACAAVIDTGSNFIVMPTDILRLLFRRVKVAGDCSNLAELPDITFQLSDFKLKLSPQAYVVKLKSPALHGKLTLLETEESLESRTELLLDKINTVQGIDLRRMFQEQGQDLASLLRSSGTACMAVFAGLDRDTEIGQLWVLGSPIFKEYYTRWSWQKNETTPKIFFEDMQRSETCQSSRPESLPDGPSAQDALLEIELGDLRFPTWARHVTDL